MSTIYSNGNVKTKLKEPTTYNENVSCEFRITEPCLPNIRLIDVGAKSGVNGEYNKLLGAYGIIKSIFLYQGQNKLDGCPNVQHFLAFKQYNKSNSVNRNIKRLLVRNQMGFKLDQVGALTDAPLIVNQSGTTDALTALAHIHLNQYLPLLDQLTVLDPAVFQNLRLVIEFNTDSQAFGDKPPASFDTRRPRLIMDCLQPGSYNPNPSNIQWNAIEQDRFVIPANAKNAAQDSVPTTAKLNGFNSKMVSRILVCKTYQNKALNATGGNAIGFGPYASFAQGAEKIQVVCNGVQLLPRNGVDGPNKMLSMLHDTWGECNTMPGGNTLGIVGSTAKLNAELRTYQGQQSYFGMFLNQRVKDLQFNYSRQAFIDTGTATPTNEALDCLVYAEISKSLLIQGNQVNILYN